MEAIAHLPPPCHDATAKCTVIWTVHSKTKPETQLSLVYPLYRVLVETEKLHQKTITNANTAENPRKRVEAEVHEGSSVDTGCQQRNASVEATSFKAGLNR